MKVRNPRLRAGHAGGHVRNTFCEAVHAFMGWKEGEPEPVVTYEINYKPRKITVSQACRLLWNCTDIMPGDLYRWLRDDHGVEARAQTYAACARAMLVAIKARSDPGTGRSQRKVLLFIRRCRSCNNI